MLELLNSNELGKLKKGLAAHYPLQGNLNDITGNYGPVQHNTLTINPFNVQTTSGSFWLPDMNLPSHFKYSICFWLRHFTNPTNDWSRNIMSRAARTPGVWLNIDGDGIHFSSLVDYSGGGGGNVSCDVFGQGVAPNGVWTHVILTCEHIVGQTTTKYQHFINGVLRKTNVWNVIPRAPEGSLGFSNNAQWCDLRLYNRAVLESEARNIYALASRLTKG